jgi:hypothetical protein
MRRPSKGRRGQRWAVCVAAVFASVVYLLWPATASAARIPNRHWLGTYTVNVSGQTPYSGTLSPDGETLFGNGSWFVSDHVITIDASSPAPLLLCAGANLIPPCQFETTATGKHSRTGISNQKHPGNVTTSLVGSAGSGSIGVQSSTWWAVRTSPST